MYQNSDSCAGGCITATVVTEVHISSPLRTEEIQFKVEVVQVYLY